PVPNPIARCEHDGGSTSPADGASRPDLARHFFCALGESRLCIAFVIIHAAGGSMVTPYLAAIVLLPSPGGSPRDRLVPVRRLVGIVWTCCPDFRTICAWTHSMASRPSLASWTAGASRLRHIG